jgi:hypothetical protein
VSKWQLWILLSPERGLLGREIRYGWQTADELKAWADARLPAFDLEARCGSAERWRRIKGQWSTVEVPKPSEPLARDRMYWMDKDD